MAERAAYPSAEYLGLPFEEAITYFRSKVDLPTERWTDLWEGMHARAFVVAGATRGDLLADLHAAVDRAISQGTTLAEFRKDFDAILDRTGWQPRGGRAWRARIIHQTNISVAYSAGHHKQMSDPAVLQARPIWRYVASSSREKRPEHMAWYGVALPSDHPWWETHYPPNDWGCKCGVVNHSAAEVERMRAAGERIITEAPQDGTYQWTNPATGEVLEVPQGIGPGWAYNPGQAAWGQHQSDEAMQRWRQSQDKWEQLTAGDWQTAGRPERVPTDQPRASLGPKYSTAKAAAEGLREILGGPEKYIGLEAQGFRYDLVANAEALAKHVPLDRTPYLPFLPEALSDPAEVWASFERHTLTGRVELRLRVIKAIRLDKDRVLLVVAQAADGRIETWTIIPTSDLNYVNRQRRGKLAWARPE